MKKLLFALSLVGIFMTHSLSYATTNSNLILQDETEETEQEETVARAFF